MGTLIRFELRKIMGNKAGMIACALALVMLAGISVLNLATASVQDLETGEVVEGFAAQDTIEKRWNAHAGTLDDARVAADMQAFAQAQELASGVEGFYDMSGREVIEEHGLDFWRQTYSVIVDGYYTRLQGTLQAADAVEGGTQASDAHTDVSVISGVQMPSASAASLQDGAEASLEYALASGFWGYFPYSEAEQDYWMQKAEQVSWPIGYGYAGAWSNVFDWSGFASLTIVAACIAVSGVFAGEYQSRADAVVLATRKGRCALPLAKVAAVLAFVTAYWWVSAAATVGINVAVCGTDGADLPIQIWDFDSPYAMTTSESVLAIYVLGYVVALGMAALTLLLSARLKAAMPVAVVSMAVTFLGLIALFFAPALKVAALTPMAALDYSFVQLLSYSIGPVAADLPTVALALYAVLMVVCVPLAVRSFARHQVA